VLRRIKSALRPIKPVLRRIRQDLGDWFDPGRQSEATIQRYPGYSQADLAVFQSFPPVRVRPQAGFFVDFLGVRTRAAYANFQAFDGKVMGHPVPYSDRLHAETIEWIGLLKAVLDARGRFAAMELGAGWGPWLVGGAVAARHRGVQDVRLCGVEGDPAHFQFLVEHFRDNSLDPDAHELINASVGVEAGTVRWPIIEDPNSSWGLRPLEREDGCGSEVRSYVDLEQFAFSDLLAREELWDLVHIDVQGGEFALVAAAADILDRRVRRMVIGTHSRKIEGDLIDFLYRRGWLLENEKPAQFTFNRATATLEAMTSIDGTQVWKNPRL
jgi:FkbM family methyltransferase